MMSTTAQKPATTPIPVQLSETEFKEFRWCPYNGYKPSSRTNRPTEKLSSKARGCVWATQRDDKSYSCCHPSIDISIFYP
jgi:hypothetical protein